MHPHHGMLIAEVTNFSKEIGKDFEVAIRFPGWNNLFFPVSATEHNVGKSEFLIFSGVLEDGEGMRVIVDSNPFPLALIAVPKRSDQPRREFGFGQTAASDETKPLEAT